jgi:hypothetical protein
MASSLPQSDGSGYNGPPQQQQQYMGQAGPPQGQQYQGQGQPQQGMVPAQNMGQPQHKPGPLEAELISFD